MYRVARSKDRSVGSLMMQRIVIRRSKRFTKVRMEAGSMRISAVVNKESLDDGCVGPTLHSKAPCNDSESEPNSERRGVREKMMISRIPYEEKESPGGKFRQPERALQGNAFSYIISARHGSATSSIGSAQARRNRKSVQEYYERRLLAEDVKKMKAK